MACMHCNREDQFVEITGSCILHCEKDDWIVERDGRRHWNKKCVRDFWKAIREDVMTQSERISFRYITFPPFEPMHIEKGSSSHAKHEMYEASSDFSFWKKGEPLSFSRMVDFSFSYFMEPLRFDCVLFKEVNFTNIKAPYIQFNHSTLQNANFKELNVNKLVFNDSLLEKAYLDRCDIQKASFENNCIEKLFIHQSHIHLINLNNTKEGQRITLNNSKVFRLNLKDTAINTLSVLHSELQTFCAQNSITNTFSFNNTITKDFSLVDNKITHLQINESTFLDAFHIGNGRISKFILSNSYMHEHSNIWFSNIKLKELSIEDMKTSISLCSLEKIEIYKLFSIKNTVIDALYTNAINLSSQQLILAFKNIKINVQESLFSNIQWGVLKNERLMSDKKAIANIYKIYAFQEDILTANLFASLYNQRVASAKKEVKAKNQINELKEEFVDLVSKGKKMTENINFTKIRSLIPKIKVELQDSSCTIAYTKLKNIRRHA